MIYEYRKYKSATIKYTHENQIKHSYFQEWFWHDMVCVYDTSIFPWKYSLHSIRNHVCIICIYVRKYWQRTCCQMIRNIDTQCLIVTESHECIDNLTAYFFEWSLRARVCVGALYYNVHVALMAIQQMLKL